jgi:hypothetical protein
MSLYKTSGFFLKRIRDLASSGQELFADPLHVGLLAWIPLLTPPTNLRINVLPLRRYFCADFSHWMRAGQVNVNWNLWPGSEPRGKVCGMQRNGCSFEVRFR